MTMLRRNLFGVLAATALGGTVILAQAEPTAVGASDPCAASELARTVGSVATSVGDYLDSHPETNQAMTTMLAQPAGQQSANSLKGYLDANPKVAGDLQTISAPLTGLSIKCRLPISVPQMLGLMQGTQGAPPGGLPAAPAGPTGPLPGPPPALQIR
ncbi:hemophore [Mycobacterium shimoidei]|uniref:hemophore n=1 Tax=Mycobacterium shimoidei TaxID=29313 RepID=UPI000A01B49B|nr:hemophore [Mycobacterium shimoidei]